MASTPRCYDLAQTFIVDSKVVKNSPTVQLHDVVLYFKSRPKRGGQNTQNKSGIKKPGVSVIICGIDAEGKPKISDRYGVGRLEYDEINVSSDGSNPTSVTFSKNIILKSDKTYAVAVISDGHEDFEMWTNKKGDNVVGTNVKSTGTTDKNVLNLYTMMDRTALTNKKSDADNGVWVPLTDEDLKFKIYVCKFSNGSKIEILDTSPVEFILYDRTLSTSEESIRLGELVYQNTAFNAGSINVSKGKTAIVGTGVDFETLYGSIDDAYIVIVSEATANAYERDDSANFDVNIRKILSIDSNTTITVDRSPTITNSAARFLRPTAVGKVAFNSVSSNFAKKENVDSWYFPDRAKSDMIVLTESNANSSIKFVNNAIEGIVISNGGTGYNNNDILTIYSSTPGSLNCTANVVTNASGGIVDFNISNTGWGMVAQPVCIISNSSVRTSNSSNGSGAVLSFIEGPSLRSEIEKFRLRDVNVINYQIDAIEAVFPILTSKDKEYVNYWHHAFYNDSSGTLQQLTTANKYEISNFERTKQAFAKDPVIVSRSNLMSGLSNGSFTNTQFALANGATINASASVIIESQGDATNEFVTTKFPAQADIIYYTYTINDDYTGENTSYGNADSKYISKKITFAEGRLAEDIMVYTRAYRPLGTDVKVFARIHNSQDSESFDDKDWTLLECISGGDSYSAKDKKNDLYEYTYSFGQYPNTQFTSPGVVSIANLTTTNVIGTGTSFDSQVQGFKAGDMVKIYSPVFPNNYFITVVTEVANDSQITIANNTANASLTGSGLYIDKIAYKKQAFRDIRFQNVVTYFSSSMQTFSGYDTVAVKIVLLSNSSSNVPEIDDLRVVGVSA